MTDLDCGYEGVSEAYVAINVPPQKKVSEIESQLAAWESDGFLEYETCEARAPGSFDAGDTDPELDE